MTEHNISTAMQNLPPEITFCKTWHSESDLPERYKMIDNIFQIIRLEGNNFPLSLPLMAKNLEKHLYRSAATKNAYIDQNTLKERLEVCLNLIHHQQQRLLSLRHASKCEAGHYCSKPFCPFMVDLWKHLKQCNDIKCTREYCISSKTVLNHHHMCKAKNKIATCEVCAFVVKGKKQAYSRNDILMKWNACENSLEG